MCWCAAWAGTAANSEILLARQHQHAAALTHKQSERSLTLSTKESQSQSQAREKRRRGGKRGRERVESSLAARSGREKSLFQWSL